MALMREKIAIRVRDAPVSAGTDPIDRSRAESVALHLAHLIGRQIAREQFEERNVKDRCPRTKRRDEPIP